MIEYNNIIAERVKSLKPSAIRKFFDLLGDVENVISLGIGEPDFTTPWHIRYAGMKSIENGYTKYTSNAGMKELRKEISQYMDRHYGLEYSSDDEVFVTVGGSEAIDLALRTLVEPGDEVIIPEPTFVCYSPITSSIGGVPVPVQTFEKDEFRLMPEQLINAITAKTKVLVLPYPNNPTGGIMEREDLEKIAQILRNTNIMIISDEIYAELTYGGIKHTSIASIEDMKERTIVVNGFSKSHAMTGWRMGFACGPKEILHEMIKLHQYCIMSAPTMSQYAAIEALREGDEDIRKMHESYNFRRKFIVNGLRDMGLDCFEPRGAFYAFPSIKKTGLSSEEFCERLLLEEQVAVIPGNAFGECGEGFVRCCYAASVEDLTEALSRMKRFVNKLFKEKG